MNQIIQEDFLSLIGKVDFIQKFKNTKWLITGTSGMIGSYLLNFLYWVNKNYLDNTILITAIDKYLPHNNDRNLKQLINDKNIQFFEKDLSKDIDIKGLGDYHFILHLASNASPKQYLSDPINTVKSNVVFTMNLLDNLKDSELLKSFVYFSSGEIYGSPSQDNIPTLETYLGKINHLNERSCYVESKKFTETLCFLYKENYRLPIKIVRPIHIYGPGFRENDGRVWADFINKAINNKDIEILSDGLAKRGFCYLLDALQQLLNIVSHGENDVYNIGNSSLYSIKELAEVVKQESGNHVNISIKNSVPDYLKNSPELSCPSIKKVWSIIKKSDIITTPLSIGIRKSIHWAKSFIRR